MKLKDKGTKSRIDLLMRGKLLYHFVLAKIRVPPTFITFHHKPNGLVLKMIIRKQKVA